MTCDKTPFKVANPGNPCCDPCIIDAFTDSVEITTANQRIIRSKQHPQPPYPSWLQVEMKVENGAIGTIFFLWDDATPEGIYIELIPDTPDVTSGYISVYTDDDTRIAGPLYIDGAVSGEWHTLTICYDPDTIPNEMVITFSTEVDQSFAVLVPSGTTIGKTAGYGSGNGSGSVWFRNYSFERLWYCGDKTEDCHEFAEEWDYYYDLPERVVCHTCEPCPDYWTSQVSLEDPNVELISKKGTSWFHTARAIASLPGADDAILGISDAIGYNKLYIRASFTGGPATSTFGYTSPTVAVGWQYDEESETFYFFISCTATNTPVETLIYEVFRVTNGGDPVSVLGPFNVTLSVTPTLTYEGWAAGSTTIHSPMRKMIYGTVIKTESIVTPINTWLTDCGCTKPMAKQYTATVAGIATADPVCNDGSDKFFDVSMLNIGPVTLKNYDHLDTYYAITANYGRCAFSYDETTDPGEFSAKTSQVWIWAYQDGAYTEIRGYALATYRPSVAPGPCQDYVSAAVEFRLRVFGSLDMRTLSGKAIPLYSCLSPYLDASGATLTLTSVV